MGGGRGVKIMNDCDVFVKLKHFYFNLIWSKIFCDVLEEGVRG